MDETKATERDEPHRLREGKRGAPVDTPATPEAPAPPPATIGASLRAAREAAGLTLAQVAEQTKVRPGILTEIETDDHDHLPALTYTLGFVKAYARTVGLDPDAAADRYRRESHKGEPVPAQHDLQPLEEQRLPSRRLGWISALLLALALAGFWAWGAGWLTPANPPRPATPGAPPTAASAEGQSLATDPAAAALPATPPADAVVTLTAKEEVWLKIADGKDGFFMGTLQPGQVLTLPAGRNWQLRTGRAGTLEVKVGNRALPPLGGPAEQVKGLSLQPADLLARLAPPDANTGGLAPPDANTGGLAPPNPNTGGLAPPDANTGPAR